MGYYNGSGVVTNGGESANLRSTGPAVGGAVYTYQRTISKTTTRNGVSLQTAQSFHGDSNMDYWQWPGGHCEPGARGTRTSVAYSQINGSNLYTVAVTEDKIQFRGKQGFYDSGWVS